MVTFSGWNCFDVTGLFILHVLNNNGTCFGNVCDVLYQKCYHAHAVRPILVGCLNVFLWQLKVTIVWQYVHLTPKQN